MNIKEFCTKRPYLYHLTDKANLPIILESRTLFSTKAIAKKSLPKDAISKFLRGKRETHVTLNGVGFEFKIRDQKPILLKVLSRSLSSGDAGDFIEVLNERVFWWPTIDRLYRHYKRYASEEPIILRVKTNEVLGLNKNVEFCHLNSGATRCHPAYGGNAPTRGRDSFVPPDLYNMEISTVAEVTFLDSCRLPETVWIGSSPEGNWELIE